MVLSDEEKVAPKRHQVIVRELNESKPYEDVSKGTKLLTKLLDFSL